MFPGFVARTLNVVPVRLSYATAGNEQRPNCIAMSATEKSCSRTSNDDHRRYESGMQKQFEGQHDPDQKGDVIRRILFLLKFF